MSEQAIHGFGTIQQDDQGRLSAEHHGTGWTITARREETLQRMAVLVHRAAARLARVGEGR